MLPHASITALAFALATSTGCSVFMQDSVRSDGVYCSQSRFWMITDGAAAGGLAYAAATAPNAPAEAYIPAGIMAASAAYGYLKRGRCVAHVESAPPEAWARDSEQRRARDAHRAKVLATAGALASQRLASASATPRQRRATYHSRSSSYRNHVKRECNGRVVIDEVFTSRQQCQARERQRPIMCGSFEIPYGC